MNINLSIIKNLPSIKVNLLSKAVFHCLSSLMEVLFHWRCSSSNLSMYLDSFEENLGDWSSYWCLCWYYSYHKKSQVLVFSIKDLSTFSTISGSRNHTISTFSASRFFCPFLQFLDPETALFLRFLDPETTLFLQFMDPEFFVVNFYNFWILKPKYFCSLRIQKRHHFYNFWGPYRS